jgi:hypothetical protein
MELSTRRIEDMVLLKTSFDLFVGGQMRKLAFSRDKRVEVYPSA